MINFQGSGFSIELPEFCSDASAYTFLLPTPADSSFTPYMTIQTQKTDSGELEAWVHEQNAVLRGHVENFRTVNISAGQHLGYDVVVATVEWGPLAARMSQFQAHYLVPGEKQSKIYCLTGVDLSSHFSESQPIFTQIFKTFSPNDIQVLEVGS